MITIAGTDMLSKALRMQFLDDDEELAYSPGERTRATSTSDGRPAWMRTLHTSVYNWLELVPDVSSHHRYCTVFPRINACFE